ncbi:MAG: glutamine-hydrolyzing carbamoyl-phosphate synthase small subunit [Acidaminococcaceae bacterium]|jgi:carbamoyl-phosphate synthase small subunit|nr:glutamine-hydrolyzing carbamoyl-phosphate synthase small subunit [Acidaminococcaceae bacterium]
MQTVKQGKLVLKDGSVYEGQLYGNRNAVGEVVFTTGMSGYQETLTDPSYCGQIVVMTYPLVGNYGTNPCFNQGEKCFYQGYVVSELCDAPSNWRCQGTLQDFLEQQQVPVLVGVDTRAITRKLRNYGVLQGVIVPAEMPEAEVQKLLATPDVHDQVRQVTTSKVYTLGDGPLHVAVLDFGIKRNILNYLVSFGCRLTVFPAYTSAEEVLACAPDGIFLSNGPGDPKDLKEVIENIKKLLGKRPIFGICLGHQLLALANGYDTFKMKFGHRGINHPVRDIVEHKICISSQNHGYAVDAKSLDADVEITNVSLNDGTIEGLRYLKHPTFAVQYHPEASPGPGGHEYLFKRFIKMMGGKA